jgi:hypothetical protein
VSSMSMRIAVPVSPEALSGRRLRPEVPELLDALESARERLVMVAVRVVPCVEPAPLRAWYTVNRTALSSAGEVRGLRRVLAEPESACGHLVRGWFTRVDEAVDSIGTALAVMATAGPGTSGVFRAWCLEIEAAWIGYRDAVAALGRALKL